MNGNTPFGTRDEKAPTPEPSSELAHALVSSLGAGLSSAAQGSAGHADFLRKIVDALPAVVAYVAADQTYRFVSRNYERWFGDACDALIGRKLHDILGPTGYARAEPYITRALSGQEASFEATLAPERKGPRWVRGTYLPDFDEQGSVRGFVALIVDISEQKQSEERLQEEARVKESLARLGAGLISGLDLDGMFKLLTDEATALCRAQFGAFFYNVEKPGSESYMLYTVSGVPREAFSKFPMPRKTAVFAPTFEGTAIVRSDDITEDPRYGKNAPRRGMPEGHLPVRSYLAVPVVARSGKAYGGLFFGHEQRAVFTERDELALVAVAAQAAVAIDNAELHAATTHAEQHYRALSESAPLLVWTTAPDGTLEYVNRRFVEYTGQPLEQMMRRLPEPILHAADEPHFLDIWNRSLSEGIPFEVEYRLRRADGVFRWFLARGTPIFDAAGAITRWVGSSTDIDDRKRAEETQHFLADAGALLTSSLDSPRTFAELSQLAVPLLGDACVIGVLTEDGDLQTVASSSEEARQTLATHSFHVAGAWLSGAQMARRVLDSCERLDTNHTEATGEAREQNGEAREQDHDSAEHESDTASCLMVPIVAQQQALGVITLLSYQPAFRFDQRHLSTAADLGRRAGSVLENARLFALAQREQRRAEEASRAKDLFLSTLSHELRTPLSAILGWTRLLQSGTLPEDKRERALATIERNARAQASMIEDVLDLARITSGKLRLDVAPVEVAQVMDAAIDTIRPSADAKGVRIQAVLDPDAGMLHGDGPRLQQVAWNLLSNAVKFTPKGGRIYVLLRRVESSIEVVVSDTGTGIPDEFLPHVFERFTQADPTRTRQQGGLGLGLSIVKHLTELHGGTVAAESGGAGLGATFTVRLPLAPLRDTPVNSASEAPKADRARGFRTLELTGLRVLVVDDEPDGRELVQSVLETCKAEVTVAKSASEAYETLLRERPEVLISDIGMPDEDGYSLIRRIRALPKDQGGRIPAVALTAYAQIADRTRALIEGFNNHVSKPAEPEELIAVVAAVAGRHGFTPSNG
jgi:PAS domain S-box-containing protein